MKTSNCCGAIIIENTDLCSDCKEHCEVVNEDEVEWIKTKDRLPSKDMQCLVVVGKYIELLVWNNHYRSWDDSEGDDHYCEAGHVEYWMSVPNIPKDEK